MWIQLPNRKPQQLDPASSFAERTAAVIGSSLRFSTSPSGQRAALCSLATARFLVSQSIRVVNCMCERREAVLAEGQRVGNYLLTRRIAASTCGEVWIGRHHAWADKLAAVKVPNDPQYVRNLRKDGVAMHGLRSPSIVEAIDFDPYADPPYLAMEYGPGTSLRPPIQGRKLGAPEAVAVLRQVLAALGHAHATGVVHRDIKPENILIHERAFRDGFSSEGVVKVTDFGLGRVGLSDDSIALSTSLSGGDCLSARCSGIAEGT
jgi:serine/threonine protein kinase